MSIADRASMSITLESFQSVKFGSIKMRPHSLLMLPTKTMYERSGTGREWQATLPMAPSPRINGIPMKLSHIISDCKIRLSILLGSLPCFSRALNKTQGTSICTYSAERRRAPEDAVETESNDSTRIAAMEKSAIMNVKAIKVGSG